jgi:hypothetical protein
MTSRAGTSVSGKSRLRRALAAAVVIALAMTATVLSNTTAASASDQNGWVLTSGVPTRRCLDFDTGTLTNPRSNVQLYNCRPTADWLSVYQRFTLPEIPGQLSDIFQIKNLKTNRCATYNPELSETANPVWAEPCGKAGQGWRWFEFGDYYRLEAAEIDYFCLLPQHRDGRNMDGIELHSCWGAEDYHNWSLG